MLQMIVIGVFTAVLVFAACVIFLAVCRPEPRRPRCGGCRRPLARTPAPLTRCPACGADFLAVGIIKGHAPGEPTTTPLGIAAWLGVLTGAPAIILAFMAWPVWPVQAVNFAHRHIYSHFGPSPNRGITIEGELTAIVGQPPYQGVMNIRVKGPTGTSASITIDAPSQRVLAADTGVHVEEDQKLPAGAARAVYNAAGLDAAGDPAMAAEADAIQEDLLAILSTPAGSPRATRPPSESMPTLSQSGSSSTASIGPMVVVGNAHIPLKFVYWPLVLGIYAVLLWILLRARGRALARFA